VSNVGCGRQTWNARLGWYSLAVNGRTRGLLLLGDQGLDGVFYD
jgi:hypothetical protein